MNAAERHRRAMEIFDEVCDLPADEAQAILQERCGSDRELHRGVRAMLRRDGAADSFVEAAESGAIVAAFAADRGAEDGVDILPERIGPYRILGKVGEGGMGIIYEAEQESPRRRVALKILRPGMLGRSMLKRFQYEAHVLGQLQHPGIAHIHEAGLAELPQGRQPYFAMEFIDGEPIDIYAESHELSIRQRLELAARVCDAVHHAHQKGVIHRDLKPSNVLVVGGESTSPGHDSAKSGTRGGMVDDQVGQPKVLDFGIARVVDGDTRAFTVQTEVGQLVGTLAHMSPEQISGNSADLDTRCDVYVLGVMVYLLLAGELPHDLSGLSVAESARRILDVIPARLGTIDNRLRGDVETIVAKAMDKDRERRYASAAELAADIRRHLNHQPIDARPASTFYHLHKFATRNKGLVASVLAAILALSVGLVLTTISARRAHQATLLAEREKERAQRAKENVELVSQFQGAMIGHADMREMGGLILDQIKTILVRDQADPEVVAALGQINPATLALAVVDGSLLSKASEAAAEQFAERPLIEADIRESLGATYFELAMEEQSLREIRAGLALRRAHLGEDHLDTIRMIGLVGHILFALDRVDEAKPLAEETLRRLRNLLPEDDELVLEARDRIVGILREQGQVEEALVLAKALVDDGTRALPADHSMLLTFRQHLAILYIRARQFEEALAVSRTLLEDMRNHFGEDHPRTLACWTHVAGTLMRMNRLDEAEEAVREILQRTESLLGEDDPRTLRVLHNLVMIEVKRGPSPMARAGLENLLKRQQRALPPGHPHTQDTIDELAKLDAERAHAAPTDEAAQSD